MAAGGLGDSDPMPLPVPGSPALVRGDELTSALGIEPGPIVGELLGAIAQEAFAGELRTPEEAIAFAAARLA